MQVKINTFGLIKNDVDLPVSKHAVKIHVAERQKTDFDQLTIYSESSKHEQYSHKAIPTGSVFIHYC